MSVIRFNLGDNFSIFTTVTHRRPLGDRRAYIQFKSYNNEVELTTTSVSDLELITEAFKQLMEDIKDENLKFRQIRSRVFNSTEDISDPF